MEFVPILPTIVNYPFTLPESRENYPPKISDLDSDKKEIKKVEKHKTLIEEDRLLEI